MSDLWTPETMWERVEPFLIAGVLDMHERARLTLAAIASPDEWGKRHWDAQRREMRARFIKGSQENGGDYLTQLPPSLVLIGEQRQEHLDGVIYGALNAYGKASAA